MTKDKKKLKKVLRKRRKNLNVTLRSPINILLAFNLLIVARRRSLKSEITKRSCVKLNEDI